MSAAIRIAAMGDVHAGEDSKGFLAPRLNGIDARADLLLIAGDLTRCGSPDEARVLASELCGVAVPIVAVLGNHDYHSGREDELTAIMRDAGVTVLDGSAIEMALGESSVGIAGTKGFGGGFPGAMGSDFGEPEMKAFMQASQRAADALEVALSSVSDARLRIALTHYSPVADTLQGERLEIYPFLGSYFLSEAIDSVGAELALHGHAHRGTEHGVTPGGVPVRNVAQPVIGAPFRVYSLQPRAAQTPSNVA